MRMFFSSADEGPDDIEPRTRRGTSGTKRILSQEGPLHAVPHVRRPPHRAAPSSDVLPYLTGTSTAPDRIDKRKYSLLKRDRLSWPSDHLEGLQRNDYFVRIEENESMDHEMDYLFSNSS
ncbi:hypothetical protein TNCT_538161 [Trichonephila clavata]|uniref:Uncharacterized protein n=1 Tax=Trichonephila clavata TaxID=2740835 RepID=A0A8X6I727_TRICU|nr:hypothetical protein TNCT_538161 [Trichonephila clavata]